MISSLYVFFIITSQCDEHPYSMTNLRDVLLELRGALPIYMHYKYSVLPTPIQGIDKGQFLELVFFSKQNI